MATISPTKNPSTAGARWLFAQQEYLRRTGDTVVARQQFERLWEKLESAKDEVLKRELSRLKQERHSLPEHAKSKRDQKTAVILLIEGELGARRGPSVKFELRFTYEEMTRRKAMPKILSMIGHETMRSVLLDAAFEASVDHFPSDVDPVGVVDGMMDFLVNGKRVEVDES